MVFWCLYTSTFSSFDFLHSSFLLRLAVFLPSTAPRPRKYPKDTDTPVPCRNSLAPARGRSTASRLSFHRRSKSSVRTATYAHLIRQWYSEASYKTRWTVLPGSSAGQREGHHQTIYTPTRHIPGMPCSSIIDCIETSPIAFSRIIQCLEFQLDDSENRFFPVDICSGWWWNWRAVSRPRDSAIA